MTSPNKKIHVVAGATATGKTNFAINLAKKIDGEIVNADSMQVYKYMNIGTNKGNLKPGRFPGSFEIEESGVIGWLFDIVNPNEEFNVSIYLERLKPVLKDIYSRNKTPIIVGGTGLYIDAFIGSYDFGKVSPDKNLRKELECLEIPDLQKKLKDIDIKLFKSLNNSEKNNRRRLIRHIEKYGRSTDNQISLNLDCEIHYLSLPRVELYAKINSRAEEMFENGLIQEVKDLIKRGYKDTKPMNSVSYKEVVKYLDNKISLEEALEKTKQLHRNYAKRQITWFEGKMKLV